jgi:hypothetical protein
MAQLLIVHGEGTNMDPGAAWPPWPHAHPYKQAAVRAQGPHDFEGVACRSHSMLDSANLHAMSYYGVISGGPLWLDAQSML